MSLNKELTNKLNKIASNYKKDLFKRKQRQLLDKKNEEKLFLKRFNDLVKLIDKICNDYNDAILQQGLKLELKKWNSSDLKRRLLVELRLLLEGYNGEFSENTTKEVLDRPLALFIEGFVLSGEVRFFEHKATRFRAEDKIDNFNEDKIGTILTEFMTNGIDFSNETLVG